MSPSDYRYCSFCHCITNMPINAYQLGSKQLSIRLLCLSVSANTFTDIYRVGIFYQVISLLIFVHPPYENCFMISVVYLSYSTLATLKPFFKDITIDAKLTTNSALLRNEGTLAFVKRLLRTASYFKLFKEKKTLLVEWQHYLISEELVSCELKIRDFFVFVLRYHPPSSTLPSLIGASAFAFKKYPHKQYIFWKLNRSRLLLIPFKKWKY